MNLQQGVADELATNLWMTERRKWITASVFGNVAISIEVQPKLQVQ